MTEIRVTRGDITKMSVDAIVNAANSSLMGGGGVDGAIHRAAGPTVLEECRQIVARQGPLPTGEAVITAAGNLPARHVIHTVGPVWGEVDGTQSVDLLTSCYTSSLDLATTSSCETVAFPNISTGVYRFPRQLAAETAVSAVRGRDGDVSEVTFVCFDDVNYSIYKALFEP
jgi:O-acetyl-ADP-ribose deacetylase (regulator of RNase III)